MKKIILSLFALSLIHIWLRRNLIATILLKQQERSKVLIKKPLLKFLLKGSLQSKKSVLRHRLQKLHTCQRVYGLTTQMVRFRQQKLLGSLLHLVNIKKKASLLCQDRWKEVLYQPSFMYEYLLKQKMVLTSLTNGQVQNCHLLLLQILTLAIQYLMLMIK